METLKQTERSGLVRSLVVMLFLLISFISKAQYPPSHDPATMIQNTDGRYWIFTTGQGIWAMSSSNADFTDWQVEPTPFPENSWPGWISNYVDGFTGFFWAPDIIKIGNTFFLYYSCAGEGAPAAIGLATATNLAGPWTDQGMVVAGNNAIDPALLLDNGRLWMSWGNWQSGIDIVELSTQTGKPVSGTTHLVDGNVEGPGLMKDGGYYYLFYQRGLCCDGLNSTYYVVVARSTTITGPYTGERVFLPNQSGNVVGPGHVGYRYGRLTYHFYDGNDNGNAKLMVRTDFGFANGWPYQGSPPSSGGSSVVQLRNRGTGLYLDGMGRTGNGDACGQWGNTTHPNSQWERIDVGSGYYQLRNVGTGLYLDGMGRTSNGSDVGQWANTTHYNSHWTMQQYSGSYYQLRNRGTGLYLDGMGRTANGSACGQWANTTHVNSQWELINISGLRIDLAAEEEPKAVSVLCYPNPVKDVLNIRLEDDSELVSARIVNLSGQLMHEEDLVGLDNMIDMKGLSSGVYFLELQMLSGTKRMKLIKQ